MQRRGTVRFGVFLVAIVVTLVFGVFAMVGPLGSEGVVLASPPTTLDVDEPVAPPNTVTEFYPENANLSDCVGLVEKPGCGSGSRGGGGQTAVFVVLFIGLGVILWRVSRGIKANRVAIDAEAERNTGRS